MAGWTDAVIVTLIAIGATVLIGVLGYLIEKSSDETGDKSAGGRSRGA